MLNSQRAQSICSWTAVLFVSSVAVLIQSYVAIKLALLVLFVGSALLLAIGRRSLTLHSAIATFYLAIASLGCAWALIGFAHDGNYSAGIIDFVRLYVLWSMAFLLLFCLMREHVSFSQIHAAMILSGLAIAVMNLIAVADQFAGWGLFPESVRKEMELYVGIHDGYVQITSNNIGALFVIVPYLMALDVRRDLSRRQAKWNRVTLVLCLLVAAFSGRRALWLVVTVSPFILLALALASDSVKLMHRRSKRLLWGYCAAALVGLAVAPMFPSSLGDTGEHLKEAFSSQDERSIQKDFLLRAFVEEPILGSGFGAYGGYLRNDERPWTYELTYHQLLFNLGIVGCVLLFALFAGYVTWVIRLLRRFPANSAIPFGILMGCLCLLIGTYSNPYVKSFDYLLFVGLLPFLSSFGAGFGAAHMEGSAAS